MDIYYTQMISNNDLYDTFKAEILTKVVEAGVLSSIEVSPDNIINSNHFKETSSIKLLFDNLQGRNIRMEQIEIRLNPNTDELIITLLTGDGSGSGSGSGSSSGSGSGSGSSSSSSSSSGSGSGSTAKNPPGTPSTLAAAAAAASGGLPSKATRTMDGAAGANYVRGLGNARPPWTITETELKDGTKETIAVKGTEKRRIIYDPKTDKYTIYTI